MGALGILGRLLALTTILLVSYALIGLLVYYGSSAPGLLGLSPVPASPVGQLFGGLLAAAAAAFVGALFTAPLELAMFGHERTWIKRVAAKSAKYL